VRLIEVKGLGAEEGSIMLTPNEYRVAQDRRDCYWLYVATGCGSPNPHLHVLKDPAARPWQPVQRIEHYVLPASELVG